MLWTNDQVGIAGIPSGCQSGGVSLANPLKAVVEPGGSSIPSHFDQYQCMALGGER